MTSGLNVDPENHHGRPDPAELKRLGFTSVRFVARGSTVCRDYFTDCAGVGLDTYICYASEDQRPLEELIEMFPGATCWILGNEPDGQPPSSWIMSPTQWAAFHQVNAAKVRQYSPNSMVATAGLCSGNPDWAKPVINNLSYDLLNIHLYAGDAENKRELLSAYRALRGDVLMVGEWYWEAAGIPPYVKMLDEECFASQWFCWSDGMVDGFGLLRKNGTKKPEYNALVGTMEEPVPPPQYEFVLGIKAEAERLNSIGINVGVPMENETYPFPNAPYSFQTTTKGFFQYSKVAQAVHFIPAAGK